MCDGAPASAEASKVCMACTRDSRSHPGELPQRSLARRLRRRRATLLAGGGRGLQEAARLQPGVQQVACMSGGLGMGTRCWLRRHRAAGADGGAVRAGRRWRRESRTCRGRARRRVSMPPVPCPPRCGAATRPRAPTDTAACMSKTRVGGACSRSRAMLDRQTMPDDAQDRRKETNADVRGDVQILHPVFCALATRATSLLHSNTHAPTPALTHTDADTSEPGRARGEWPAPQAFASGARGSRTSILRSSQVR